MNYSHLMIKLINYFRKLEEGSLAKTMDETNEGCLICYEAYTPTAEHRAACLKCGHIFGKKCVEQWIRKKMECPTCKVFSNLTDVRSLYGNFSGGDSSKLNELRAQNNTLQTEKTAWQNEREDFVITIQQLQTEKMDWQVERVEFDETIQQLVTQLSYATKEIEDIHNFYSIQADDETFA